MYEEAVAPLIVTGAPLQSDAEQRCHWYVYVLAGGVPVEVVPAPVATDVLYVGELFAPENVGVLGADGVTPLMNAVGVVDVAESAPAQAPVEFVAVTMECT